MKFGRIYLSVAIMAGLWTSTAHAAGPRFHAECGHRAWKTYLNAAEDMLPGISGLNTTDELQRAFLSGCQFPDWGYRGINQDGAEDSHWTPFHKIYLRVLDEKYPPTAWKTLTREAPSARPIRFAVPDDAVKRRWSFFLGAICHGAADIPYHFDDGPNLGMLSRARKEDGSGHGETEVASDIITQKDCGALPAMIGEMWWPYDDILAAYAQTSRTVDTAQLDKAKAQVQTGTNIIGIAGSAPYFLMQSKHPWLRQHNSDYYFGGLDQGAALTDICVKYWYARLQGWHYLQNFPDYGGWLKGLYDKPPCEDAVLNSAHPGNNTGAEPWLEVGGPPAAERRALIRFDLSSVPPKERLQEARLWLYGGPAVPRPALDGQVVDAFPVNRAWAEGKGFTNDVDGTEGTPAQGLEVSWESVRHGAAKWAAPGCASAPEDHEAQPAASAKIATAGAPQWVYWDLTALVQTWLQHPDQNHGILLQSPLDSAQESSLLRFWSSQAFRNQSDGYCGGIRIAGRPTLVIITVSES